MAWDPCTRVSPWLWLALYLKDKLRWHIWSEAEKAVLKVCLAANKFLLIVLYLGLFYCYFSIIYFLFIWGPSTWLGLRVAFELRERKPRGLGRVRLWRNCQRKVWAAENGFWAILGLEEREFLGSCEEAAWGQFGLHKNYPGKLQSGPCLGLLAVTVMSTFKGRKGWFLGL